ncbi:hypothetical protein M231_02478 [Tremella mesenterica]|uniref:Pali-domain-containing protein n=1 Tax=Tremella mesenterica TaxID=5217 RepID=A0A4Q1BQJ0_TREME|nr:hypothetical protein M231_02478 [Tremella mesenterica]
MAIRYRSATPGTLLSLSATILLAIVSFNTPLLKSLFFLKATYSSGQDAGILTLGTLGYCLTTGTQVCVGPRVGYEFDPNALLGITLFNIPETITHYLTYTLILHIIALAFSVLSTIFGLLSHISSLSLLCFPTCFASLTSTFSLLALIFDLVIFYIAKARIDDVSGASASIGICVWLTLAAWLLAGFAGCAYGIGRCCVGSRNRSRSESDSYKPNYQPANGPDEMRLKAIRDEQLRKKEQDLPSFPNPDRSETIPLTAKDDSDDKYLYEDQPVPGGYGRGLNRDGSVVPGVGTGYGRRNKSPGPNNGNGMGQEQTHVLGYGWNRPSSPSAMTSAGEFVGVGAGGAGVERPEPAYGIYRGQTPGGEHQYYEQPYQEPYQTYPPYQPNQYPTSESQPNPYSQTNINYPPNVMPQPVPTPGRNYEYSSDPRPNSDPYGGYEGVGVAAMQHDREYTGSTFGHGITPPIPSISPNPNPNQHPGYNNNNAYGGGGGYTNDQIQSQIAVHQPIPQHLVNRDNTTLLRSPLSPQDRGREDVVGFPNPHSGYGNNPSVGNENNIGANGTNGYDPTQGGNNPHQYSQYDERRQEDYDDENDNGRPPSYGAVAASSNYRPPTNEKYR